MAMPEPSYFQIHVVFENEMIIIMIHMLQKHVQRRNDMKSKFLKFWELC